MCEISYIVLNTWNLLLWTDLIRHFCGRFHDLLSPIAITIMIEILCHKKNGREKERERGMREEGKRKEREKESERERGREKWCTTHQSGLSPRSFPADKGRRTDESPGCWTQWGSLCPASLPSFRLPLGPPGWMVVLYKPLRSNHTIFLLLMLSTFVVITFLQDRASIYCVLPRFGAALCTLLVE